MGQSFGALYFHVIFSTKNRAPLISAELQPALFAYMGGVMKNTKNVLLAAGGVADHVHLLLSLHRDVAVSEADRLLKANSSKWVHDTYPTQGEFAWQNGYGAFSVSYSLLDSVKIYLARQEEHHRHTNFQHEFIKFLNVHDIEYDEQYLWD
jgi:REP element-mobilizing transposase RayT